MDTKQIKEIAEIMRKNSITSFELNENGTILRMERGICENIPYESPYNTKETKLTEMPVPLETSVESGYTEIKSPMVGVFYAAPSPDSEPFVKVGSKVKKGDTLCIIEAMKLLNEINAESDGEIMEICAANGQVIEFGQVLFKIK